MGACQAIMASEGLNGTNGGGILKLYVTEATTSTETAPDGCGNVEIQAWGAGGNEGGGAGGGGGGGGAYTRCSLATKAGNTLVVTCTQTALGGQTSPGYTVASGNQTISKITAGCGTGGKTAGAGGAGGGPGTATNGNSGAVITNGNAGTAANNTGGAGISGNVTGDGSPYGGGQSSSGTQVGAAGFYYT